MRLARERFEGRTIALSENGLEDLPERLSRILSRRIR